MLKAEGSVVAEGFDQSDHERHAAKQLYTIHGRTLRFSCVNLMNVVFAVRGPLIVRLAKIGQCGLLNEVVPRDQQVAPTVIAVHLPVVLLRSFRRAYQQSGSASRCGPRSPVVIHPEEGRRILSDPFAQLVLFSGESLPQTLRALLAQLDRLNSDPRGLPGAAQLCRRGWWADTLDSRDRQPGEIVSIVGITQTCWRVGARSADGATPPDTIVS
jgi:hypothetical protein